MKIRAQDKTKKEAVRFGKVPEIPRITEQGYELKYAGTGRGFKLPLFRIGNARKGLEWPIK